MPDSGLKVYLLDCPVHYCRPGGLYQDAAGLDWPDNALRFGALCQVASALALDRLDACWRPDVVHLNDWHTGPTAALIGSAADARPGTLFTVHNMAFQGLFPLDCLAPLGLEHLHFASPDGLEFYGKASFLKAGLRFADAVTTVSPTCAREILTPELGFGLEGVVASRPERVSGVLNGVDETVWNPACDPYLPANFDAAKLIGKRVCKMALQAELGLDSAAQRPLVAFISRLTRQKMADTLLEVAPSILELGADLVVHGAGDADLEVAFQFFSEGAGRLVAKIGYQERLAHRLHAGADIVLAPARFEPCGLAQLCAMRYGALPVVRRTGGLADTVVDAVQGPGVATGFTFEHATVRDLLRCVERAVEAHREPVRWRRMQINAMSQDHGWSRSARTYAQLYRQVARRSGAHELSRARTHAAPEPRRRSQGG